MGCGHWWVSHAWEPWKIVARGALQIRLLGDDEFRAIGEWMRQERKCRICGLTQLKTDDSRSH